MDGVVVDGVVVDGVVELVVVEELEVCVDSVDDVSGCSVAEAEDVVLLHFVFVGKSHDKIS